MNPKVSVIIVNYNGEQFLKACLDSLVAQTFPDFEIVVVDNNSSDRSIGIITERYPDVILIRNESNLGFAAGTNQGIKVARGEYILTLNNDTRVETCFLEEIVRPMEKDPLIGACASRMLFPNGRINSAGMCISRSGAAWNRGMFDDDRGQYSMQEEVFGASAGAALYRKTMLDEIGFFDEDFFMYMEDVDLSFRARLAGWKCEYVPTAVVYHHHGGTAGYRSKMSIYFGNRNMVWYVVKDYPVLTFFACLPWIAARNSVVILYYIVKKRGLTILDSKVDAIRGVPKMIKKRKSVLVRISESELNGWFELWFCQV